MVDLQPDKETEETDLNLKGIQKLSFSNSKLEILKLYSLLNPLG